MKRTCYAFMAAAVLTVTFVGGIVSLVIKGWAADKTCFPLVRSDR